MTAVATATRLDEPLHRRLGLTDGELEAIKSRPVSYKNLTLPTNREV
jgi:hypothetical protein